MKITYNPSPPATIHPIHCPKCGERVKRVGLDYDNCSIRGLKISCNRCKHRFELNAESGRKN